MAEVAENLVTVFQFTHPCGCDRMCGRRNQASAGFNSRTRVGATRGIPLTATLAKFQFTHPCGCDDKVRDDLMKNNQFQFTHPCGCDGLTNTV